MDLLILIYGIIGIKHDNYLSTKRFSNLKTERGNVRFCYNPRMRISKASDRRMPKNAFCEKQSVHGIVHGRKAFHGSTQRFCRLLRNGGRRFVSSQL